MKYIFEFLAITTIMPILLIPVEMLLPYPYIVEELAKFFLVKVLAEKKDNLWHAAIVGGFLFTLTETFLYLPNIVETGDYSFFYERLFYTGILHCTTFLTMFMGWRKNYIWAAISLSLAVATHYLFNWFWMNRG